MWYAPTVTTPPASEPVTLVQAKRQLWVDHTDDDALIDGYIAAARNHVEGYCGARFAPQTVTGKATEWADLARLPVLPATSVTYVAYIDVEGAEQTLSTDVYELRGDGIVLKYGQAWPATQPGSLVTVTFVAGATECPPAVRHAILLWIADAYKNRESAELPEWTTMDALLCNHRYYP